MSKNKIIKRILAAAGVLVLTVSLGACSGCSVETGNGSEPASSEIVTSEIQSEAKTSEEKAVARNNIGSPSVDELNELTKKEIDCIEATDTGSYETAPSTVAIAHPFEFVAGGTYIATLKVISGTFLNANDIIRVQQSASTGTGTTSLLGFVFRLNDVTVGETYTQAFTAHEGCVNLLARYKFDAGTQNIELTVKKVATVKELINETSKKVDSVYNDSTIKSRMLMGAHRGAEYYAPPNCVAAYEIAGKMGFPWAWLAQIRWSSTGTLYVMHDADVSITTNGTGNIQDLTDEYIDSLLCNKLSGYDYSQFTDADLRVPTLEKAIQICLRYGMKMCFRIEPFPNQIETELQQTIWDNFETLVKAYGIQNDWCCFSGYNTAEMARCVTLFGEDVDICPYLGAVTAQDVVDWFNSFTTTVMRNKSVLLLASNITLADVKLLHTNGIKVYAFTNSTSPTQEQMEQLATWGVDILQNPRYARIPTI